MKGAEVNFLLRRIILFFFVAKFSEKMEKYLLVVEGSGADEIWSFCSLSGCPSTFADSSSACFMQLLVEQLFV